MIETWANIPGYDGKYQVDRNGSIRRVYESGATRILKPFLKNTGQPKKMIINLTINGKTKEVALMQIVARTFLGPAPKGYVPYHKNGCQSDNYVNNIAYISRKELGKKTGQQSRKKSVAKINSEGEIVEFYRSARECAKQNYMSLQAVADRCNGLRKSAFAPDGFAYAWEDSEVSMRNALKKIKEYKETR